MRGAGNINVLQDQRDLKRFAIRLHKNLNVALGLELNRPLSDSAFRNFFRKVVVENSELQYGPEHLQRHLEVKQNFR